MIDPQAGSIAENDNTTIRITRVTQQRLLERLEKKYALIWGLPFPLDKNIRIFRDYNEIITELLDMAEEPPAPEPYLHKTG